MQNGKCLRERSSTIAAVTVFSGSVVLVVYSLDMPARNPRERCSNTGMRRSSSSRRGKARAVSLYVETSNSARIFLVKGSVRISPRGLR
jgi:hypothetical protein